MDRKRWAVGISGASGAPIAVALLKALKEIKEAEIHLVIAKGGEMTLKQECGMAKEELRQWADRIWDNHDLGAPMASGSWKCGGMVVVPSSMKTVAGIANGFSENLLLRAADVMIKERRPLILVAREAPLSTIHLKNMLELSRFCLRCSVIIITLSPSKTPLTILLGRSWIIWDMSMKIL